MCILLSAIAPRSSQPTTAASNLELVQFAGKGLTTESKGAKAFIGTRCAQPDFPASDSTMKEAYTCLAPPKIDAECGQHRAAVST